MLYGAINVSPQKAPEYFKEATAGLKQMQLLKEAKEEKDKSELAKIGDVPLVSSANMWDSHARAAQKAAEQLKGMKDELMQTEEGRLQYQTMLDELDYLIEQGESHYKVTSPTLQNNLNTARAGGQYEGNMMDSHDESWYVNEMNQADSDIYDVRFEDGHIILDDGLGGMRVNDPRLMNNSRFDAELVRMDPMEPDAFWRTSIGNKSQILDNDEAKLRVRDAVSSSRRTQLDVAEWWRRSQDGVDADGKELPSAEAIINAPGLFDEAMNSYVDAAVEGWSPAQEAKRGAKSDSGSSSKGKVDAPAYLDEGRFGEPDVSSTTLTKNEGLAMPNTGFGAFPEEVKEVGEFKTAKETYTFPGDGFNTGKWNISTIEYDTASDPAEWVITLNSGEESETARITDNFDTISTPTNSLGPNMGNLNIQASFEAKHGKDSWGGLLYEIRDRAVKAAGN